MLTFLLRATHGHGLFHAARVFTLVAITGFSINSFAGSDHDHHDEQEAEKLTINSPNQHDHDDDHGDEENHVDTHQDHDGENHGEDKHDHDEDSHDHNESVRISEAVAQQFNITTAKVTAGTIAQSDRLYGKVVNDATQISHIGARFDGTIMQVNVNIGDTVKKGQALARIESNQSLHPYIVKAPFAGMITDRHANPGELTQDQPLFTLFNDAILWAEFKIFPQQMRKVKAGQTLIIDNETFTIAHIIPSPNDAPYNIARVRLDNHDHGWSAGIVLKADVMTQEKMVPVRVVNQAIHTLEGKRVVFIKQGNRYLAKPITLGLQDNEYSEILAGVESGEEVVVTNSYLIKADFEKSGAEHVH
ncbi:MAG: efflux RND transporter periplasmic adaptor subunit [Gammaproteobacteria bacterium]|nr:efflux RND transporter periplasmic adaptor subunit [Gammaproteobacteria bacterium]